MAEIEFREAVRQALDEELEQDERDPLRRGRRDRRRSVRRHAGTLREVRRAARLRHADLGARATGAAYGAADIGPATRAGDHVRRLPRALDGRRHQPDDEALVPDPERHGCPVVIRSVVGAGGRFGAIHSQMPASWLMGITGLKLVAPATAGDAKGLLKAAIRDDDPVVFLEHKRLYPPDGRGRVGARADRAGGDRSRGGRRHAGQRHEGRPRLPRSGRAPGGRKASAPRSSTSETFRPVDLETVMASVVKTNRVGVVEEGPLTGGWASEVVALVVEQGLGDLDDAWRITTPNTPIPVQPAARGRLPARRRPHRRGRPREVVSFILAFYKVEPSRRDLRARRLSG